MTDKTQALLPVTQADRDLVFELMRSACTTELERRALRYIKEGRGDDSDAVQMVARHRISHSLPGTAEQRAKQAAENWRVPDHRDPAKMTAMVRPKEDCVYGFEQGYLAALTPSALSGEDAAQHLQDHMEQRHGVCLSASEWDTAIREIFPSACPGDAGEGAVSEALGFGTGNCASLNLQGALDDLQGRYQVADGGVIARTIKRVIRQIEAARAALPPHQGAE